jgi:hypothetical protein
VKVEAGLTEGGAAGWFQKNTKQIRLGTAHPIVFLHELSHAVDNALPDKSDDYAFNEVVAELSAAFLASLYGVKFDIAGTKSYIDGWSGKGHVAFKLVDALQRMEQIYQFIESKKGKKCRAVKLPKIKPRKAARAATQECGDESSLFSTLSVKEQSQLFNPKIKSWVRRDACSGVFRSARVKSGVAAYRTFDDFDDAS